MSNYIDNEIDASYALEGVILGEANQNQHDRISALNEAKEFLTDSDSNRLHSMITDLHQFEYELQCTVEEIVDELKNNMAYNK
jgi:ribosomal protein S13